MKNKTITYVVPIHKNIRMSIFLYCAEHKGPRCIGTELGAHGLDEVEDAGDDGVVGGDDDGDGWDDDEVQGLDGEERGQVKYPRNTAGLITLCGTGVRALTNHYRRNPRGLCWSPRRWLD